MKSQYAIICKIFILCSIFDLSASVSFAAKDPWVEEMKNAVGLSVGDLTPTDIESGKPERPVTVPEGKPGAEVGVLKPISPDGLNPDTQPDVAAKIREWLSVAQPPKNAVPGNHYYYDKFGRMLGSGKGMKTIRQRDDVGYGSGATPEATVWTELRNQLDSIDHCTLEEYVVAKLNNESIGHCKGRYGGVRDLTGERLAAAKNAVENAGFNPSISVGSPAKSPEEEGTIEKQEPDWKEPLKKGATIKLVVHSPYVSPGFVIPDFIGQPLKEAKEWLKDNNLLATLKPGSAAPSPELSGAVEAQAPKAGTTLKKGKPVSLTVHSAFVDVSKVPNITGMKLADAKEALRKQGLAAKFRPGGPAPSRDRSGTIESQASAAGSTVEKGTIVTLNVHSKYVEKHTVPGVSELSASRAKSLIADAGLKPVLKAGGASSSQDQAGTVKRQEPTAGTTVKPGSKVEIFVYGPYVAKALPPRKDQISEPQAEEETIEDRILGSEWIQRELIVDVRKDKAFRLRAKPKPGRMKFVKDGNRIVATVIEEFSGNYCPQVGGICYEISRKAEEDTFVARRFMKDGTSGFVFLRFTMEHQVFRLSEGNLEHENDYHPGKPPIDTLWYNVSGRSVQDAGFEGGWLDGTVKDDPIDAIGTFGD